MSAVEGKLNELTSTNMSDKDTLENSRKRKRANPRKLTQEEQAERSWTVVNPHPGTDPCTKSNSLPSPWTESRNLDCKTTIH